MISEKKRDEGNKKKKYMKECNEVQVIIINYYFMFYSLNS